MEVDKDIEEKEKDFDASFEQAAQVEEEKDTGTTDKEEDKKEESAKEEEPTLEEEKEEEEITDEDDPALILQRYKTLQGMYKSQKNEIDGLKKISPVTEESPKVPEVEKKLPLQETPNKMDMSWIDSNLKSTEGKDTFGEEFPEVKSYIQESLKSVFAEYIQAESQVLSSMMEEMKKSISPLETSVKTQAEVSRENSIIKTNPEFLSIRKDLENWANSKSGKYKTFYNDVLETGDAKEVSSLIEEYHKSVGKPTKIKAKPKVTPETKPGSVNVKPTVAKDEFEAAFDEAINGE